MRYQKRAGLTLIETALIISAIGIVLAVVIPTFIKTLKTSKVAEASIQLNALYRAASAYYTANYGDRRRTISYCLPAEAGPTPENPSQTPVEVDFFADQVQGVETWRALDFNPTGPLRFRYSFLPRVSGCSLRAPPNTPMVILRAEGDLDGDNDYSTFERTVIMSDQNTLALEKLLFIKDRVE
jgi:type II secretory pathway pseudopilin PulG